MTNVRDFIKRHPVSTYFVLTFAISWGGFFWVVVPGGSESADWQIEAAFLPAVLAMLAGPSVAGVVLTGLIDGRAGLRGVVSRLLKWRVGTRWYVAALLPAPLISPIFTTADKSAVLLSGAAAGLTTVFEDLGWTGSPCPG
jgi:hypothetical protein